MSDVRAGARALFVVLAAALALGFLIALTLLLRLPTASRSLLDISRGSYLFLTSLDSEKSAFSELRCTALQSCQPGDKAGAPALGWRLLAHARMWHLTGNPEHKAELERDFTRWKQRANGWDELWSLHQLYEVYLLTKDEQYLGWFWGRISLLQRLARESYGSARPAEQTEPMLVATIIRELAQASRALRESESVFLLRKWEQFSADAEDTASVNQRADELADLAGSMLSRLQAKLPHNRDPLASSLQGTYQYICWEQWSRSALFSATGDERHLSEIKRFFESANFRSLGRGKLRYHSLQSILPCIHTLIELRAHDPQFESTAHHLLRQIAEISWDSPDAPVCDGDAALYSFPVGDKDGRCPANIKSGADNSWFVFLIDEAVAQHKGAA